MSETSTTDYILIALIAVSLIVSGLSYMSISPIAKNTKDLADSIETLTTDLSEGIDDLSESIDGILTKLGEVVEPDVIVTPGPVPVRQPPAVEGFIDVEATEPTDAGELPEG